MLGTSAKQTLESPVRTPEMRNTQFVTTCGSVMPGKAQELNGKGKGRESNCVSQYSAVVAIGLVLFLPTATLLHHYASCRVL